MKKLIISDLDVRASSYSFPIETITYCDPARLEDGTHVTGAYSLHAPYYELTPCAIDPAIGAVSRMRYRQAVQAAARIGAGRVIIHSGYQPRVYYPEWFVPKSVAFWKEFVKELPEGVQIALENVFDTESRFLAEIVDSVADERLGVCLDIGHANVYADEKPHSWIRSLGERIVHVHLHDNNGNVDSHLAPGKGGMDFHSLMDALEHYAPRADLCLETTDAKAGIDYLKRSGHFPF